MISLILATSLAWGAECDLASPADAPFTELLVAAEGVMVVVELWADEAPGGWLEANLGVLDDRGLAATVVARPDTALAPGFARAVGEHPLALRFDAVPVKAPGTEGVTAGELRKAAKVVRKQAGLSARTVAAPTPGRLEEALLRKAGFREILDLDGSSTSVPRRTVQYDDQLGLGALVPAGPYGGACGLDPVVGPLTPAAADRAGRALAEAGRTEGLAVMRVGLDGVAGVPGDAQVLARWLDQVVVPSGARLVTPRQVRQALLRLDQGEVPERGEPGGRLVTEGDLVEAALSLASVEVVPRDLPGALNPTEAFMGFALWLAERSEGAVVRLGKLEGPASGASTSLDGPVSVPGEAVVATASALVAAMPTQVPSALPVDGQLLTAGEILLLFASAVRGEDPANTHPVAVPEPHVAGLGWGVATLP